MIVVHVALVCLARLHRGEEGHLQSAVMFHESRVFLKITL